MALSGFYSFTYFTEKTNRRALVLGVLVFLAVSFAGMAVQAQTFRVSTEQELIDAINDANENSDENTIIFENDIELTADHTPHSGDLLLFGPTTLPDISSDLIVDGNGYTLSRSNDLTNDIFFRFFFINEASVAFNNITLLGGYLASTNNGKTFGGGTIFNAGGDLKIVESEILGSSASADGGAVYNLGGTVKIINSRLQRNTALFRGNHVFNNNESLLIENSFLIESYNDLWYDSDESKVLIGNGTLARDGGGAIYNMSGSVTINNSAFRDNYTSGDGGVIYNEGVVVVTNSTLFGNFSLKNGGAFYNTDELTLNNVSMGYNTVDPDDEVEEPVYGRYVYNEGGAVTWRNSVLTDILDPDDIEEMDKVSCFNDGGTITTNAFNLVGYSGTATSGCPVGADDFIASGGIFSVFSIPFLRAEGNTETFVIANGSPVIDAAGPDALPYDQLGISIQGSARDVGASEYNNGDDPVYPTIEFSSPGSVYSPTDGTIEISLQISGASDFGAEAVVYILDNGTGTGEAGVHYEQFPYTEVVIDCSGGCPSSKTISLTILDNELVNDTETIDLKIAGTNGFATIGGQEIFAVTIEEVLNLQPNNGILYVDQDAEGDGSGNSWNNAIPELRDALAWAEDEWDGADGTLQIWVADGLYLPTDDADREVSFKMINHVEIYGGFAGDEDPDGFNLADRDFEANETALSGDIGVEDDDSDNAYHVFYHQPDEGSNLDNSAVLDGVTISGGRADGFGTNKFGAGMYNNNNSPTLMNVTFKDNISFSDDDVTYGGGLYNENSDPVLENVIFSGNEAQYGGGMFNRSGSNPTLTNVTFHANEARFGGGIYNHQSSPTLINVLSSGNNAIQDGGGIMNYKSNPILTNVTISGNTDGGMVNTGGSYPILKNSIVWGNSGSDINDRSGGPYGTNSTTIEHSIVSGEDDPDNGNIDDDPLFMDPISSDSAPTTGGDYRLQAGSPAISAGDNDALPDGITSDLAGNPRIDAVIVDMGAYEFQGASTPVIHDDDNILYVDQIVSGGNETGNSWANAIPELRDALAWAQDWEGDTYGTLQIWVAEGVYLPTDDDTDRDASFQLVDNVQIYGGFAGGESNLDERDWDDNLTILSGDIDDNDDEDIINHPETQIKGGNSYRVVLLDGTTKPITSSTVIDGFTITAGQEDSGISSNGGGGIRCEGSGPDGECSPVIRNTNLSGNMTLGFGGGMYIGTVNGTSNPIITNVLFSDNWSKGDSGSGSGFGGGVYHYCSDGESNPVFTNVLFSGNSAYREGGGILINPGNEGQCSTVFKNALFTGNSADDGGAIFNRVGGNVTLINSTFIGNQAEKGGAVLNVAEMTLANSIFWGNSAEVQGNDFYNSSPGDADIINSTLNTGDSDDVVSDGTLSCTNCSDLDPLFSDPTNGDFTLSSNSPAINAGTNTPYQSGGAAEGVTTDLAGNDRIYDGGTVDMGAYEFQGDPDEIPQGQDQRLLVGNHAPYVFSGNDFSLNSSVETVWIIGFSGFGSLELDGSDVGYGEEIPAEDISNNLLTFIPSESVAYGYDYAELTFQLIDDVGRVSEESASITIDVAATSVELTGGEGWRFLGNPSEGNSYDDLLGPVWTKGMAGSDSPHASSYNVYVLDQNDYIWRVVPNLEDTMLPGSSIIVYVYADDNFDGSPDGFPKTLTSGMNWLPLDGTFDYSWLGDYESEANPDSFYLVANPHPIAIDFCEMFDKGSVDLANSVAIWDPSVNSGNGDYRSLSCSTGEVFVAPFQGFWVRTTGDNPELEIPESAYLEGTTDEYFKDSEPSDDFVVGLYLSDETQTFTNKATLLFSEYGTAGLDAFDAPKLSPQGLANRWLSFYSLDEQGKAYAFQSLPTGFEDKLRIPLDIQTTESGRFILDWSLPESHVFGGSYYLKDNQSGEVIELQEGASYSFEITPGQAVQTKQTQTIQPMREIGENGAIAVDTHRMSKKAAPRFELLIAASGVDGFTELGAVPEVFELAQNYPNPFNPTTVIRYQLPVSSEVRLEVYDMLGRNVATLVDGQVSAGRHTVNFDAGNLSSGIYLYRLQAGSQIMTRKLTVVK